MDGYLRIHAHNMNPSYASLVYFFFTMNEAPPTHGHEFTYESAHSACNICSQLERCCTDPALGKFQQAFFGVKRVHWGKAGSLMKVRTLVSLLSSLVSIVCAVTV